MKPHTYVVTVPIAGHITFEVEAKSEEEAKRLAWECPASDGELEWEPLNQFNSGNVCHCPYPWQVEVEDYGEADS